MSCAITYEKQDYIWARGKLTDLTNLKDMLFKYPDEHTEVQFLPLQANTKVMDCYLVSQELKDVMMPFVKDYDGVEFIPVRLMNHQNEIHRYYIMHFTRYEDAIDYEHSKILDGMVLVPTLKAEPIQNLHLFTIQSVAETIVSRELRLAIIKAGQKTSLMFDKVRLDTDIVE